MVIERVLIVPREIKIMQQLSGGPSILPVRFSGCCLLLVAGYCYE